MDLFQPYIPEIDAESKKLTILEGTNRALGKFFIPDFEETEDQRVRIRHGLVAGWVSIVLTFSLFVIKVVLGLISGSISVLADAFHLLSHLANSIILVLSFWIASKPATAKTPFGHGRMEHIGPLIMSIFLFGAGVQIGEQSFHHAMHPKDIRYWPALPWILAATILVKLWLGQFITFLGIRVGSHAIMTNAGHQRIEAISTTAVIAGLLAAHLFHLDRADGYLGIGLSAWILYLGYTHARHAVIPLLGKAPDREMIREIREVGRSVNGIEDLHEIIVNDYGSMFLISFHAEIPERYGPAAIHEIVEQCERKIRGRFGGEAVCHSDPLPERTPEIEAIEDRFKEIVAEDKRIKAYHDFRIVKESEARIIIVADIDADEETPESEYLEISSVLERKAKEVFPNLAYCSFYVTPKFAY